MQLDILSPPKSFQPRTSLTPPFRCAASSYSDECVVEHNGHSLICSCSEKGRLGSCFHVRNMKDIYYNKGKAGALWIVKSAFHKELRRNNLDASLAYGRLFAHMTNNSTVKRYIFEIVCEETRNFDFLKWSCENILRDGADWPEFVIKMVSSKKKWEIPTIQYTERILVESRYEKDPVLTEGYIKHQMSVFDEHLQAGRLNDALLTGYRLFPPTTLSGDDRFRSMVVFGLVSSLRKSKNPKHIAIFDTVDVYMKSKRSPSFNEAQAIIDILVHPEIIDEGCNSYPHSSTCSDEFDFYPFEDRAFDNHVRDGISRLVKGRDSWWSKVQPERVDMRWSGNQMGNLWRYLAFDPDDSSWQDKDFVDTVLSAGGDELWFKMVCLQSKRDPKYISPPNEAISKMSDPPDLNSILGESYSQFSG